MAVATRGQAVTEIENQHKRWKERDIITSSPERVERSRVYNNNKLKSKGDTKVAVVYYLSRNGQLEHPHFMEVPLSSSQGLFLKDVINRLNSLRGKGMATMYSWSSKRSYKNGFVWHDLSESDFIYPAHGNEYVLKGSELLISSDETHCNDRKVLESASSRSLRPPPEIHSAEFSRRRNQSWSSIDLNEYKVFKTESLAGDSAGKSSSASTAAADASTQTDDRRSRRRPAKEIKGKEEPLVFPASTTELSRGEISPPPSDSSPETLESLMKADGRLVICSAGEEENRTVEGGQANRTAGRASTVLMQLISCGSASFKNCGPALVKDHGLSLIGQRVTRGGGVKLEEKEYFSGSIVEETKKQEEALHHLPSLQRSTSYNADRSSQLDLTEEELGVRTKCIPRKPKGLPSKKESHIFTSCDTNQGTS